MFRSARLKLTIWYLLIVMFISITFSVVIYRLLTDEFKRFERLQRFRIERRLKAQPIFTNPELIEETKQRLIFILIFINSGILIISGGLGYFLAGRTLKPIKEMVDEQNRFISDASHELKTPLTSLKSAFEVYLRDKNRTLEEADKIVSESIVEADKIQSLSENLLQLAQYQKQNNRLSFEKISLPELINKAISKIAPIAKKKKIIINFDSKNIIFEGNKEMLINLFVIVLDNAIKYSFEKNEVFVKTKQEKDKIIISVKDQGIGIFEKELPHIFDRFYRADTARSKSERGGYGLGLSIAKNIVGIHQGSIDVESELNKGSTFTIRLPIHQSNSKN